MAKKSKKLKKTVPAIKDELAVSTFQSADTLIRQLAVKDVDIGKLEKLLEIKGKYEAEENKKLFQRKFADLQYDLPIIKKTKSVDNKYKYAPLEHIVKTIKPMLKEYGFSYRWSEGISEDKSAKRIMCHIMAYGHEEVSYVDIPLIVSPTTRDGRKIINDAQVAGSMSTYGKRYSLIGALGIMADEDDDGVSIKEPVQKVMPAKPEKSKPELIKEFQEAYRYFCKIYKKTPSSKLSVFCAQLETMEAVDIDFGLKSLQADIKKLEGGK